MNLAIKGHATRGKEVIEILEMLGGKNDCNYGCDVTSYIYSIDVKGTINWYIPHPMSPITIFTLEEFLEKFPYKVGDKVIHSDYESPLEIVGMRWENDLIQYEVYTNDYGYWFSVDELQPYKEETMDKVSKAVFDTNAQCCNIMNHLINEETMEEQIKIDIPKGYEFFGVDDDNKVVLILKQPKYPKTYKECCAIVNASPYVNLVYNLTNGQKYSYDVDNLHVYENLRRLLICRDAYWKIAGAQMGLGKPWKPDWLNTEQDKFVLYTHDNVICLNRFVLGHNVLAFPTAEMRDAFLENFKDLIEACKELL